MTASTWRTFSFFLSSHWLSIKWKKYVELTWLLIQQTCIVYFFAMKSAKSVAIDSRLFVIKYSIILFIFAFATINLASCNAEPTLEQLKCELVCAWACTRMSNGKNSLNKFKISQISINSTDKHFANLLDRIHTHTHEYNCKKTFSFRKLTENRKAKWKCNLCASVYVYMSMDVCVCAKQAGLLV